VDFGIRHLLDFSYKICHCCRNLQLLVQPLNKKGEHIDRS
jgi:hypothetical protein